jgi:hypothetical protein
MENLKQVPILWNIFGGNLQIKIKIVFRGRFVP